MKEAWMLEVILAINLKLKSCPTNDTQFSDLSILRTKIYDFKLVYFSGTPGINVKLTKLFVIQFKTCIFAEI